MNRITMGLSLGLAAALAIFGCGSSTSDNTDAGHGSTDAGNGSTDAGHHTGPATTFNEFYTGVIQAYKCLNCHVPGGPGVEQGDLDMSTPALAYANLVN